MIRPTFTKNVVSFEKGDLIATIPSDWVSSFVVIAS